MFYLPVPCPLVVTWFFIKFSHTIIIRLYIEFSSNCNIPNIYLPTFSGTKAWDFHLDLWNHFAHIRKYPKTLKFTKTIRTFPKMFWRFLDFNPRISFAKHNLFSFENQRIFHWRTAIYAHFSIYYWFEYNSSSSFVIYQTFVSSRQL